MQQRSFVHIGDLSLVIFFLFFGSSSIIRLALINKLCSNYVQFLHENLFWINFNLTCMITINISMNLTGILYHDVNMHPILHCKNMLFPWLQSMEQNMLLSTMVFLMCDHEITRVINCCGHANTLVLRSRDYLNTLVLCCCGHTHMLAFRSRNYLYTLVINYCFHTNTLVLRIVENLNTLALHCNDHTNKLLLKSSDFLKNILDRFFW